MEKRTSSPLDGAGPGETVKNSATPSSTATPTIHAARSREGLRVAGVPLSPTSASPARPDELVSQKRIITALYKRTESGINGGTGRVPWEPLGRQLGYVTCCR